MADPVRLGVGPLATGDILAIARSDAPVVLDDVALARIEAGYRALEALAAGGAAIYGVSTGLGAGVDTRIAPDPAVVQRRIPPGRAVGVGRTARRDEVRAIIAARLAGLCAGRSGASRAVVEALAALLNQGVHPVVPMTGSVGEADLAPLSHIALVLLGQGEAEFQDEILPAAEALARAGLLPPEFGLKDGLALVSANAASVGAGALVVEDAARALRAMLAAAALSFEGYRAGIAPLDPRAAALRPAPGQAEAARVILALLDGGDLAQPGAARKLQDPLSFRCAPPVLGAALAALQAARESVELELAGAGDNPAVIAEDGIALPNANFDPTHLALVFEALGAALARAAAISAARIVKLMSPASSDLPRFLAPVPDGSTGYGPAQKTAAALLAEIGHLAAPMPVAVLPVADGVEDYATMATAIVDKTAGIVDRLRLLAALELIVAAQAVDLRGTVTLGSGTAAIHAAVRGLVPRLEADRPAAPDIAAVAGLIAEGGLESTVTAQTG
ncbi:MAG: histidine ammonia-lyase [Inquilinus limosus]|uniref:Histidine ammonia-lyase n=1 Tax=Inquilinus limosus TaxID=171674 RepID=A0A952FHT2_9PROT|nr:histidine ammonia-lyase [Inquilinus limosus]